MYMSCAANSTPNSLAANTDRYVVRAPGSGWEVREAWPDLGAGVVAVMIAIVREARLA
jgi:hypothetical protein